MNNKQLEQYVSQLLNVGKIRDYCPNGLQVEGRAEVQRVVCGVTASQALIDRAVDCHADAIFVHHGYFWKNEDPRIIGMKKSRLQALIKADINLYAYHLPLDVHPLYGNNAQLATLLDIEVLQPLSAVEPEGVVMLGQLREPMSAASLTSHIQQRLGRTVLAEQINDQPIKTLAWCTGGGQSFIQQAAEAGVDAFISGEVSEQTIHIAREMGIHFIAAGHHATERYGIKALGQHLADAWDLQVEFIDIDNPA